MSIDLKQKSRKVACVATLTAAGLSFGLVACGGDSSSSAVGADQASAAQSDSGQTQGAPPGGMPGTPIELTAKQEECLAGEGVALPQAGETSSATPDPEEMQAAAEACGIEMPDPPSGQPDGPTGAQSGTAPSIESSS